MFPSWRISVHSFGICSLDIELHTLQLELPLFGCAVAIRLFGESTELIKSKTVFASLVCCYRELACSSGTCGT